MSSLTSDIKTEGLAKKLAQSTNQKCNFKYLMNSKTSRSFKSGFSSKQNQIQSVIVNSAHRYANKTSKYAKFNTEFSKDQSFLSLKNGNLTIKLDAEKLLVLQAQNKPKQYQNRNNTKCKVDLFQDLQVKNALLELQSKVKTDFSQTKNAQQIGCMTEECYYQKELLIKMDLMKKERDDIRNSVSDIVKQNFTLKQIVAQLTIDAKTSTKVGVQTEQVLTADCSLQTELQVCQIDEIFYIGKQSQIQLQEAKQRCLKLIPKTKDYQQSLQVGLKDLLVEVINLNLINISKNYQREKQLLVKLSCDQIENCKKEVNSLKSELSSLNSKLQQSIRMKENMKKVYQRQLGELKSIVSQKQICFINDIMQLKQEWQDILTNHQIKNKFYLQYFQNTKDCFRQKQTLYSTLLSQSHKTIHNLMGQMKEFSHMANTNYHKHLRKERSQQHIDQVSQDLE